MARKHFRTEHMAVVFAQLRGREQSAGSVCNGNRPALIPIAPDRYHPHFLDGDRRRFSAPAECLRRPPVGVRLVHVSQSDGSDRREGEVDSASALNSRAKCHDQRGSVESGRDGGTRRSDP